MNYDVILNSMHISYMNHCTFLHQSIHVMGLCKLNKLYKSYLIICVVNIYNKHQ